VRRKVVLLLTALAAVLLWRRAAHPTGHVNVVFDDGSGVRLDRGVEARDLLDDTRELLAVVA
jgi:hypothetical protein